MCKIKFLGLMIIVFFDLSCAISITQNITSYPLEYIGNSVEYKYKDKKYEIQCDADRTKGHTIAFLVDQPEGNQNAYTPYKIKDLREIIKDKFQTPIDSEIRIFTRENNKARDLDLDVYELFPIPPRMTIQQIHLALPDGCKIEETSTSSKTLTNHPKSKKKTSQKNQPNTLLQKNSF
jgi:hypothetical protein